MIRFRRIAHELIDAWLIPVNVAQAVATFRVRVRREERESFEAVRLELAAYADEALDDARRRLRRGFEDTLSPFSGEAYDPAENYPASLHRVTLQGYLGETLGALAVEHWGAHGLDSWRVPALLFRTHDVEFQHLEIINERLRGGDDRDPDDVAEMRPGRTGDDGLAFLINDANAVTHVLVIEAKCVSTNSNSTITEAHQKLSAVGARPSGIRELINLLAEYDTDDARLMQEALIKLHAGMVAGVTRLDSIAYACGQIPRQPNRTSWIPATPINAEYKGNRNLEANEFQLTGVDHIVDAVYRAR